MEERMKRCLVVEDREESRMWIEEMLREVFPGIHSVQAGSVAQGVAALCAHPLDMAVVDLGLPDGSGVDLVRTIRDRTPHVFVTVMTLFDDDDHLFQALSAGAMGYLLKGQPWGQTAAQLRGMQEGVLPMAPSIARRIMAQFTQAPAAPQPTPAPLPGLSEREREVLQGLVRGETVKEIARRLNISPATTSSHVQNIYTKLEVNNRGAAVAKAVGAGVKPG